MAREYDSPASTRLLREGDHTAELSILGLGRAAITEHVHGRGSMTVMTIEPGDVFGWSAVVDPYRAVSNVVSLEPVHVIAFDGDALLATMRADRELAANVHEQVLRALSTRLVATRHQLLDVYGTGWTDPGVAPR
jgi:CRP/FNR family cyclic AMP-dependent transcriptional regulator